jgi:hypothetical protein
MKVKFVTAIYNNLFGTEYGGRQNRGSHYKWSLFSLLRMTDADFVCYTSKNDINKLEDFFFNERGVDRSRITFKVFELPKTKHFELINKIKNVESVKSSDRCFEIQYNKFFWLSKETKGYDYCYWIDAGLCHCGLIPNKYLVNELGYESSFFNSYFFDNQFLSNLLKITEENIILFRKENQNYFWSFTVPEKYYNNFNSSYHVIGGLFGGKIKNVKWLAKEFEKVMLHIVNEENRLFAEEQFMGLIYGNNKEKFTSCEFDIWWNEDSGPRDLDPSYYDDKKSFYKCLEGIKFL